jgi:hypothetical protein
MPDDSTPADICDNCHDLNSVVDEFLHYIDTMYPIMWQNTPTTARQSLRNTLKSYIRLRFL